MTEATHTAAGYRASRNERGALVVHDVPIFVDCERGDVKFNAKWIKQAVAAAMQGQRDGYMPPLHIRHHEPSTDATNAVRAAGFFEITGTKPITFKGRRCTAIMADLHITDPMAQIDVIEMRLPYRSVEIFNVEVPAINGLALLDHEAPFLELPMLMVSSIDGENPSDDGEVASATFSRDWQMDARVDSGPVVACFRRGESASLLFRNEENPMKTPEQIAADTALAEAQAAVTAANFAADEDDKDKGKDKPNGENVEGDKGTDVSALIKMIESREISVADMDLILAAIQQAESGKTTEEEEVAPAATPGAEAMKGLPTEAVSLFAKQQGENEALKARLDARDEADATSTDVAAAMTRLAGRPLGADLESRLVTFRRGHGAKAFNDYVDGMAKTTGVLPGDNGSGAAFLGSTGAAPEVAMKYSDKGTDAVDRAANFCREWKDLHGRGATRMTEKRYVEINMMQAPAK